MKKLKKTIGIISFIIVLIFSLSACKTEKLDTAAVKAESQDDWMEDQDSKEADKSDKADKSKKEITTEDSKDFDVDSVKDDNIDFSKYEEKKSSKTTNSGNNGESVTYSDGSTTDQDEYQTNPVPEGKQNPVEPGDIPIDTSKGKTCYISISCDTILNNMDELTEGKEVLIPADGVLFSQREVTFYEGESVFDVLKRETQNNRIHMSFRFTPGYNSNYIEAIGNLYERDCGAQSGWMFCVNDWYPNYGCSRYIVQDGDVIEWNFTCDGGFDLGEGWMQ